MALQFVLTDKNNFDQLLFSHIPNMEFIRKRMIDILGHMLPLSTTKVIKSLKTSKLTTLLNKMNTSPLSPKDKQLQTLGRT
jgi:hypothetical protein